MKKLKQFLAALALMFAPLIGIAQEGNPKTPSMYSVLPYETGSSYLLCWGDTHGHGNCQDLGEVLDIVRAFQIKEKESAI